MCNPRRTTRINSSFESQQTKVWEIKPVWLYWLFQATDSNELSGDRSEVLLAPRWLQCSKADEFLLFYESTSISFSSTKVSLPRGTLINRWPSAAFAQSWTAQHRSIAVIYDRRLRLPDDCVYRHTHMAPALTEGVRDEAVTAEGEAVR